MPGPEGSISKLHWSEANQRLTKLALELLGPDAALGGENAPYGGYWQHQQLRSRGNTIEAGHLGDAPQHRRRARARPSYARRSRWTSPSLPSRTSSASRRVSSSPPPGALVERNWQSSAGRVSRSRRRTAALGSASSRRPFSSRSSGGCSTAGPYFSTVALDAARAPLGAPGGGGRRARRAGRWPSARSSPTSTPPTSVAIVGGDGIFELEGAEREVLQTTDATRPLGVVRRRRARPPPGGRELVPELRGAARVALALEACGVGRRALEYAVEHASTREQFGSKIGTYQAVSHPLASRVTRARARPLARALGRLVRRRRRLAGRRSRPLRPSRRRPRLPSPPASARSRRTAASASPGSTSSTACTSAHSWIESSGRLRPRAAGGGGRSFLLDREERGRGGRGGRPDHGLPAQRPRDRATGASSCTLSGRSRRRLPDKSWHTYTYADFVDRAKRLTVALRQELGLGDGDRVGHPLLEPLPAPRGVPRPPDGGFVTHTLNLRLHADDLTYIATHAGDRACSSTRCSGPWPRRSRTGCGFEHVIAVGDGPTPDGAIDYEELLATAAQTSSRSGTSTSGSLPRCATRAARPAGPKGVVYSHRAIAVHTLAALLGSALPLTDADVVPPGRADVPRERVGLPVLLHDDRRQAGLPRPAPRPAEPARRLRRAQRHGDGRRADDLAGHPADARCEPRRMGPLGAEGDGRRRRGCRRAR